MTDRDLFPKKTTTSEHLASAVKTGTGAFVVFKTLDSAADLVQGILRFFALLIWGLIKKIYFAIKGKVSESKPTTKEVVKREEGEDDDNILNRLSAGEKLAFKRMFENMKKNGEV